MFGNAFAQRRQTGTLLALQAVDDPTALRTLLSGWRFSSDDALVRLVWEALREATPQPCAAAKALSFAALPEPTDDADLSELQHRERLWEHWEGKAPTVEVEPLVWAVDALGWLGRETEEVERAAWLEVDWRTSEEDATVATLWRRLSEGAFWTDRGAWGKRLTGDVVSVFRQVVESRQLPSEVVRRAIADLRDVLPYKIAVGGKTAGGLVQICARMLETGPLGPLSELLHALSDTGRADAAACIAQRGHWPDTLTQLFPKAGPRERAVQSMRWVDPARGEALLDLHVALRLASRWTQEEAGDPATDWAVVVQNRGRSRGRLRALVCEEDFTSSIRRFLGWPSLAQRTRAAVRRWAWEWVWEELALDFSFDAGRPVGVPCKREEGARPVPLEGEEIPILGVWVLRVVLRGRLGHLRRWVADGTTGDHDATWGRLLVEIPDALRDAVTAESDARGRYGRVRAWLSTELEGVLTGYRPLFAALGGLPVDRSAMVRFRQLTDPVWHAAIPRIASGMPTVRRFASEALALSSATLISEGEDA